jgi:hypothetical protein
MVPENAIIEVCSEPHMRILLSEICLRCGAKKGFCSKSRNQDHGVLPYCAVQIDDRDWGPLRRILLEGATRRSFAANGETETALICCHPICHQAGINLQSILTLIC